MDKTLLIFDIDNTIVTSYEIYDEAYRLTSKELLSKEFIMTQNPDGTPDTSFNKMSNPEILANRLSQLSMDQDSVGVNDFFSKFDEIAKTVAETQEFTIFTGAKHFIKELSTNYRLVILTTGSRQLQLTVLKRMGIIDYFDIDNSLFLGDFTNKKEAIEQIYSKDPNVSTMVHFGDTPKDISAIKSADIKVRKLAIGVAIAEIVKEEDLINTGVDFIIHQYNKEALAFVRSLI